MMRSSQPVAITLTLTALSALGGCGSAPDSSMLLSLQESVSADRSVNLGRDTLNSNRVKHWTAPYPERSNPFRYPGDVSEPELVKHEPTHTAHVSVLGFANIDRPLAILKIRDSTRTLGDGDQFGELRVLSVVPPSVTLQMSNLVWTISMFDNAPR